MSSLLPAFSTIAEIKLFPSCFNMARYDHNVLQMDGGHCHGGLQTTTWASKFYFIVRNMV